MTWAPHRFVCPKCGTAYFCNEHAYGRCLKCREWTGGAPEGAPNPADRIKRLEDQLRAECLRHDRPLAESVRLLGECV